MLMSFYSFISWFLVVFILLLNLLTAVECHTTLLSTRTHFLSKTMNSLGNQFKSSLAIRGGDDIRTTKSSQDEENDISWNSHVNVDKIPSTLLRKLDGSQTMRSKFEQLCRNAQVSHYKEI